MQRCIRTTWAAIAALAAIAWTAGAAQTPATLTSAGSARQSAMTPPSGDALSRRISLRLERVTLDAALDSIAAKGHVRLVYSRSRVPLDRSVSLVADSIAIGEALSLLLRGTGVDISLSPSGGIVLDRGAGGTWTDLARQGGTIAGAVLDSATGSPVPYANVGIVETGQVVSAGAQGRYTLPNVAPGDYHIAARRVGYTPKTRAVTVLEGQVATVNFALNQPPTKLDEVVTTAVGDQRRYTVGNAIATIKADSITPTAPITSLTDLMSARAPGVEIEETNGLSGSGETVRIRGLTSLVLQNDPILIVDGVRQDNSAGGDLQAALGSGNHPTPTRLNDIDFNDIETIDVLKGPAASTEYGTDAANGVIVIVTRHGTIGRPQWRLSAEQTVSDMPAHFDDGYYSWGHTTTGAPAIVNCPQVASNGYAVSNGNCAVDSVTRWNPLNHANTSLFGEGNRQKYDLSVTGGSEAMRYYVSGDLSNDRGIVEMPLVFRQFASRNGLALPSNSLHPNSDDQRSIRANTTIRLGPNADLSANGAYLSTYQQAPETDILMEAQQLSQARNDSTTAFGYFGFGGSPLVNFTDVASQQTNRFTGGLTANWHALPWLTTHASVGVDHGSQEQGLINPPGLSAYNTRLPFLAKETGTSDLYSVDLRATATAPVSSGIRSSTSAGLQVVDSRGHGQSAFIYGGITAANETLNGYANPTLNEITNRAATLGGYGEEQLAFLDRLFVTGALRVDAGSGFGSAYHTALYPKASVSWLAFNTGPTTVRLRGAFGESGVQPQNGASFQLFNSVVTWSAGQTTSGLALGWPGNPHLQPERTAEFEGGFDLGLLSNRVTIEFSGYSKLTQDALVNVNLGSDLAGYLFQENIGKVRNSGVEGTLTAGLIQAGSVTWDVTVNAALNHNRLVTLAPGIGAQVVSLGGGAELRQAVGFPLYGLWAQKVSFADRNHDGLIEMNEITIADSNSYFGPSQPTQSASLSTHVGFWRGLVSLNALFDYRGGNKTFNAGGMIQDYAKNQREGNAPDVPLSQQARYAASQLFQGAGWISDASFIRFRELGITVALPAGLARAVRTSSLSLTGAVRNLKLWTRYSGADPEVNNPFNANVLTIPTVGGNGNSVNNDIRADWGSVPLARYWVLRLTAGL